MPVSRTRGPVNRVRLTGKTGVALTFDDGARSFYSRALPILEEYQLSAHLFVTTGFAGKSNSWPGQSKSVDNFPLLDWQQIEYCADKGIHIECHTVNHPDLRGLSPSQIVVECEQADAAIECVVGRRPRFMAYPYGYFDNEVQDAIAGRYRGCVTTQLGFHSPNCDPMSLPRLDSYYFKNPLSIQHLFTPSVRVYVKARSMLRTLRGSQ